MTRPRTDLDIVSTAKARNRHLRLLALELSGIHFAILLLINSHEFGKTGLVIIIHRQFLEEIHMYTVSRYHTSSPLRSKFNITQACTTHKATTKCDDRLTVSHMALTGRNTNLSTAIALYIATATYRSNIYQPWELIRGQYRLPCNSGSKC